jgi:hypothetical protein
MAALCSAAVVCAAQKVIPAEAWLARLPSLPATSEAAYAQWSDISGVLKPGPELEKIREGLKSEVLSLSRPLESPGTQGSLSRHDQVLSGRIAVFPGTAVVLQGIQAARTSQAALTQKWNADLQALEQRRLRERGALPACHNEAGATPSQLQIREVELAYAQQKTTLAAQYLQQFQPLLQQLLSAVSPRIAHGDAVMGAWEGLQSPGALPQLAPVARGAEANALLDVGLVQNFIEAVSKVAARPVADRKAIERVYALAKGC